MARFGPFGPAPCLAAGVSGGADSTALVLLAASWARQRGGECIALIVDHGLRPESGREAAETAQRLAGLAVRSRVLRLRLSPGAALQARAREARHAALAGAAREAGIVHLLLGHHAGDQDELRVMRARRGVRGLAGMAGVSPRDTVMILRPLLGIPSPMLRDFLVEQGVAWVEDPSNLDPRFERVRVRRAGASQPPGDVGTAADDRAAADRIAAADLACHVTLRPEGWAIIRGDALPPDALAALLRVVAGQIYPPARAAIGRLAGGLRPATLGGVRILPAGRHGPGWMLVREAAACARPIPRSRARSGMGASVSAMRRQARGPSAPLAQARSTGVPPPAFPPPCARPCRPFSAIRVCLRFRISELGLPARSRSCLPARLPRRHSSQRPAADRSARPVHQKDRKTAYHPHSL
ncbi:unnamed protein product [Acidocella sp. C78]|uniref:tRNA lysidine(34) synthetase TilS n=1 Tax=Acidocella sp. C78 TaxID=1671486 RepID=UPI001BBEC98D|nr:tRNA lysidine(34) synthetase TilS [Acidocella sp. C78]CAG4908405.1 unnamed protein product [Acidocella sp. C78]